MILNIYFQYKFAFCIFYIINHRSSTAWNIYNFSTTSNITLHDQSVNDSMNSSSNVSIDSSNNLSTNADEHPDTIANEPPAKQRKLNPKSQLSQFEIFRDEMIKNQDKKLNLIEKIVQKSPEKSDLELFFNSIFKTVQRFTRRDQAVLKIKIHQIVSEKEMSYLESNDDDLIEFK